MEPDYEALQRYNDLLPVLKQLNELMDTVEGGIIDKFKSTNSTEEQALQYYREVQVIAKLRSEMTEVLFRGEQAKRQQSQSGAEDSY